MSTLFIKDNKGVGINPVALYIPEFREVYAKHKDKEMAEKELAYIYFVSDYKSDYSSYGNDKEITVARDIMPAGWKPDERTKKAVEKYKDLQKTTSIRFLEWSRLTIASITDYFKEITIMPEDNAKTKQRKVADFDPSKVVKLLKDVEPILDKLNKIEEKVMKEESLGENKIRGGGDVGFFEDPDSMNFLN